MQDNLLLREGLRLRRLTIPAGLQYTERIMQRGSDNRCQWWRQDLIVGERRSPSAV